ncbi:MAG: hypothetical protein AAFY59_04430, partial [Pseudomonadota bacterium]
PFIVNEGTQEGREVVVDPDGDLFRVRPGGLGKYEDAGEQAQNQRPACAGAHGLQEAAENTVQLVAFRLDSKGGL